MLSRNDQPIGFNFNFGTQSVFNNVSYMLNGMPIPVITNAFLLLDSTFFLLLDLTNFLLLE